MKKDKGKIWEEVYLIGIKGVGMTMLAQFLSEQGTKVSGSDGFETFMTDAVLKKAGIEVFEGFSVDNIPSTAEAIIYSAAYLPQTNEELGYALQQKDIPVYTYAEALGKVFSSYRGIAVCGSHGKTTVSAWLGYVLERAGLSPSVLVGARVPQFRGSSLVGTSDIMVAEADEYRDKLQYLSPRGILLTNIDYDHPDYFRTRDSYYQVFVRFIARLPRSGWLVFDGDDKLSLRSALDCPGRAIGCFLRLDEQEKGGFSDQSLIAHSYERRGAKQYFSINDWGRFSTSLIGIHNVKDALLVAAAAKELGVSIEAIRRHLAGFKGTARRAQWLGEYGGALIYDDYGHHPTEVKATIKAFRDYFPDRRLRVLFHPHTFSRTKALFKDFVTSFSDCDNLAILEIYGSAREKSGGIGSRDLLAAIKEYNIASSRKQGLKYLPDLVRAQAYFAKDLQPNDVLLLLGAGDVFRVGEGILRDNMKKI